MGVHDIIIDPGFGFGKTVEDNYRLLNMLDYFKIFELAHFGWFVTKINDQPCFENQTIRCIERDHRT
jgi:hypothetical protein